MGNYGKILSEEGCDSIGRKGSLWYLSRAWVRESFNGYLLPGIHSFFFLENTAARAHSIGLV